MPVYANCVIARQAVVIKKCVVYWQSYLRPIESFKGNEVKKTVLHRRTGIITPVESDYIEMLILGEFKSVQKVFMAVGNNEFFGFRAGKGLAASQLYRSLSWACSKILAWLVQTDIQPAESDYIEKMHAPAIKEYNDLLIALTHPKL